MGSRWLVEVLSPPPQPEPFTAQQANPSTFPSQFVGEMVLTPIGVCKLYLQLSQTDEVVVPLTIVVTSGEENGVLDSRVRVRVRVRI